MELVGRTGLTLALGHIQPSGRHFAQLFYALAELTYGFVGVTNEK